jgi:hypothetical protein
VKGIDEQIAALARQLGHEQIFIPVIVEVTGVDAHAGLGLAGHRQRDPRDQGRVLEGAVMPVEPELVFLSVVGDVDIHPPVAVEVCCGYTECGTVLTRDTRFPARVDERLPTLVDVQAVLQRLIRRRHAVVESPRDAKA